MTIMALRALLMEGRTHPMEQFDGEDFSDDDRDIYVDEKPISELLGLPVLGFGHFSIVYGFTRSFAIKVSKPVGVADEDGYPQFVEFVRRFGPNPHLPCIKYHGRWGNHTVTVLERLTKVVCSEYELGFVHFQQMVEGRATPDTPELARLVEALPSFLMNDVCEENVMLRGSTFVLTDPYGFET